MSYVKKTQRISHKRRKRSTRFAVGMLPGGRHSVEVVTDVHVAREIMNGKVYSTFGPDIYVVMSHAGVSTAPLHAPPGAVKRVHTVFDCGNACAITGVWLAAAVADGDLARARGYCREGARPSVTGAYWLALAGEYELAHRFARAATAYWHVNDMIVHARWAYALAHAIKCRACHVNGAFIVWMCEVLDYMGATQRLSYCNLHGGHLERLFGTRAAIVLAEYFGPHWATAVPAALAAPILRSLAIAHEIVD